MITVSIVARSVMRIASKILIATVFFFSCMALRAVLLFAVGLLYEPTMYWVEPKPVRLLVDGEPYESNDLSRSNRAYITMSGFPATCDIDATWSDGTHRIVRFLPRARAWRNDSTPATLTPTEIRNVSRAGYKFVDPAVAAQDHLRLRWQRRGVMAVVVSAIFALVAYLPFWRRIRPSKWRTLRFRVEPEPEALWIDGRRRHWNAAGIVVRGPAERYDVRVDWKHSERSEIWMIPEGARIPRNVPTITPRGLDPSSLERGVETGAS